MIILVKLVVITSNEGSNDTDVSRNKISNVCTPSPFTFINASINYPMPSLLFAQLLEYIRKLLLRERSVFFLQHLFNIFFIQLGQIRDPS